MSVLNYKKLLIFLLILFLNIFNFEKHAFSFNSTGNAVGNYYLQQILLDCKQGADKDDDPYLAMFYGFSNQIHFTAFRTWYKSPKGVGFQRFDGSKYNETFTINGTGGYSFNNKRWKLSFKKKTKLSINEALKAGIEGRDGTRKCLLKSDSFELFHPTTFESISNKLKASREQIESRDDEINELEESISVTNEKVKSQQNTIDFLKEEIASGQTKIAQQENLTIIQKEENSRNLDKLRAEKQKLEVEISALKEDNFDLSKIIENLESKNLELSQLIKANQDNQNSLREELKAAELAEKKVEEERKAAELAEKKAEEERKAAELAEKKAEEERKAAELAEKKAEEERKAAELAEKKAEEKLKKQIQFSNEEAKDFYPIFVKFIKLGFVEDIISWDNLYADAPKAENQWTETELNSYLNFRAKVFEISEFENFFNEEIENKKNAEATRKRQSIEDLNILAQKMREIIIEEFGQQLAKELTVIVKNIQNITSEQDLSKIEQEQIDLLLQEAKDKLDELNGTDNDNLKEYVDLDLEEFTKRWQKQGKEEVIKDWVGANVKVFANVLRMKLIEEGVIELTVGLKTNSLFARNVIIFQMSKARISPSTAYDVWEKILINENWEQQGFIILEGTITDINDNGNIILDMSRLN